MQNTSISLEIFGEEYEVLSYNIRFSQEYNPSTGSASGVPIADVLYVEVVSMGDNNFVGWMIDHTKMEDGELTFKAGNQLQKTIKFKGVLVGYSQNFGTVTNALGGSTKVVTEDLTISFVSMNFGDVDYTKKKQS